MKGNVNSCRYCGKKIGIITWGIYRKVVVDAEPVRVVTDPEGEEFMRADGSKVQAREATAEDSVLQQERIEQAYRPHRKTCGRDAL